MKGRCIAIRYSNSRAVRPHRKKKNVALHNIAITKLLQEIPFLDF